MVTAVTVWGCTLAGVWARLGRVLVPGGGVFLPVGVLEEAAAAAGTKGDRGRLLGAAGDGGLFLGFRVLRSREEMTVEVKYEQEKQWRRAQEIRFHVGKSNDSAAHTVHN